MKILFVCHRLPFPPNRGGKIRPFNMISHLARKHSVVVASLAQTDQELREGSPLRDICDEVIAEVLPDSVRWLQAVRALMTSTPSSVAYFWSAHLHERIKKRTLRTGFDVVIAHCAFVAHYAMTCQNAFRILDFGDLDSAKWAEYARRRGLPLSLGYALESKKLKTYERALARRFQHCTVTTWGEEDEFRSLGVSTPCSVIPNGVDTAYFSSRNTRPKTPMIVFLGRMDYFPNIDGVFYFVENILPLVREKNPNVQFQIIGSNPSRKVRELAKLPGITVTGHVPDVRSYVASAVVSVAPLRIARGTQNKILESMAMGVPVVASPQAAKGIQCRAGEHLLVAEDPEEFGRYVVSLLADDELQMRLAAAARTQIEDKHAWPTSMKILDELLGL